MKTQTRDIFITFLHIGGISFGASASQALVDILVEKKKWLSHEEFKEYLAIAGLSPGPFHVNFVIKIGFQLAGFRGMLLAITGFTLPALLLAIVAAYAISSDAIGAWLRDNPGVTRGILAAVAGLLFTAVFKLGRESVQGQKDFGNLLYIVLLTVAMVAGRLSPFTAIIASGVVFLGWHAYQVIKGAEQ